MKELSKRQGTIEMIEIKRAYESTESNGSTRFLVDRIWPRGVKKEDLQIDDWIKEVAPSTELRKWFGHDPEKWAEFQQRYNAELDENPSAWEPILKAANAGKVTLVYAAKDEEHNNAVALKQYIEDQSPQEPED